MGLVVLGDTYSPGWVASVDGRTTPVYEAYGVVRAVQVPAGRHRIVFEYRPRSVLLGVTCGGMGLLALLACLAASYRPRRSAGGQASPEPADGQFETAVL